MEIADRRAEQATDKKHPIVQAHLARLARCSVDSVRRLVRGEPVRPTVAERILAAAHELHMECPQPIIARR